MKRVFRFGATALRFSFLAALLSMFSPQLVASQVVVTQHNDNGRTGQNLQETVLNTSNVNVNNFGKLFTRTVDGQIYAQPLYLPNQPIKGAMHNVVYVATMHNSVYAFDADDPTASTALWQVNLGTSVPAQDVCPSCGYQDIKNEIGILSTPVIDTTSGTIYVVAKTKNTANSTYHFSLHALDVLTGAEKFTGPKEITGQVAGTGAGSSNGTVVFDPLHHLNRPGLLLLNGTVYLAFGSVGDIFPYHGWVMGYDAGNLGQVSIFNASPNGSAGAIWQAGMGLVSDSSGFIYLMTGNGSFNANSSGTEYGDSFIKLSTSGGLSVSDYFTPFNQAALSQSDADLGSGGPVALPGTGLIVGMGKDKILRLVNTQNMGKFNATTNNDVQEFQPTFGVEDYTGGPVYWNSPNNGPVIYLWGSGDSLKAFKFTGSLLQTTPVSQSSVTEVNGVSSSVPLSLSANGSQAGTGIVWAAAALSQDPNQQTVPGILRAFDASNLSVELWNSRQSAARDDLGNFAKFVSPTVADGKVFVATFSNQLVAYGLNPSSGGALPSPWSGQDVGSVGLTGSDSYLNGSFLMNGAGSDIWGNADSFNFVSQPLNGDGQIVARVFSLQNTNAWAKGGVMIRETLAANSTYAMVDVTPVNGSEFSRRLTPGAFSTVTNVATGAAPYWVKLVRSGNTFSGYISADGVTYTLLGTDTISMASSVYIGLALTSHDTTLLCSGALDNVTVTGQQTTQPTVSITAPANGATFNAPANITVSATATGGTGTTVSQVDFFAGTTNIGTLRTSPYNLSWNNVAAGSYSLTAMVTDSSGATATSAPVGITVTSSTLPSPWLTLDIGSVGVAGSAGYAGGTFTLNGSGADIYGTADAFRFVYQPLNGDGQIVARVFSLQNTNVYAKGGVMIRETLAANSRHAMMEITPVNGSEFLRRTSTGGISTVSAGSGAAPYWVKVVRSGNTFSGYVSADGVNFVLVGSSTITMASSVYIGLVVTSHNNAVLCKAVLDGVTVTGGAVAPPTVSITLPANGASFVAPANITINAAAAGGTGAQVSRVDFYAGTTLVGSDNASPYSISWSSVPAGSYSLTAQVTDSLGAVATSSPVGITVTSGGLPSPWLTQDIGSVGVAGSAGFLNGVFSLSGSGADIWATSDAFRYVYHTLSGNGQIVARVASLQNTNAWAKSGVMIRETLTANSRYAMMDITPVNGSEFSRRLSVGAFSTVTNVSSGAAPYWVKLVRSGNTFSGYVSTDGVNFVLVGSDTISMASSVYIGLVVTSHNNTTLCTTSIDGVQ